MELESEIDDFNLPDVAESEFYELGQCIRHKSPYPGEAEKMIIQLHPQRKEYSLIQIIDGKTGYRERITIKYAHYFYEKV